MYNRYVPQPDGSYHRSRVADPIPEPIKTAPHQKEPPPPSSAGTCQNCANKQNYRRSSSQKTKQQPHPQGIGSFLKQLIPKGFDTEDLLIILLLLLIAGDCQEDQNTALLTLVLYLFL